MGTATQSTTDRDDLKDIKRLIRKAGQNSKNKEGLSKALGKAINKIIFEGDDIAPVRNTVTAAIAKQIKTDILPKFKTWEARGSKPNEFPFKSRRKSR
jgi:hypothetical protein